MTSHTSLSGRDTAALLPSACSQAAYVGAFAFEAFLYGMYLILFYNCSYVLFAARSKSRWYYPILATITFGLSTAHLGLNIKSLSLSGSHFSLARRLLYIMSNIISSSFFAFRCFTLWNNRWRVIFLPCICLLCSSVYGYLFTISALTKLPVREPFFVFLWMVFGINAYTTFFTIGRVWWIMRNASSISGTSLPSRYCAAILESGAPYTIYILLCAALSSVAPHSHGKHIFNRALVQVSGIVHTLIIVHLALGHGVRDVETIVTMTRVEQLERSSTPVLDTIFSTVGSPLVSHQTSQALEDPAVQDIEAVETYGESRSAERYPGFL